MLNSSHSINILWNFLFHNLLISKYYKKKREIIRNSFNSDKFLKRFFRDLLNFENFRNIFFKKSFFAYSFKAEKAKIIKFLNDHYSIKTEKYIEYANTIMKQEFSIFEKNHKFQKEIDWHHSFFTDFKWKLEKSENINIRPKKINVDVKYVWEFNRHQFLPYLGFAYYITKNEKYAKEFKCLILDWIKNNPPLYGINWYSGLEISIRLISWIFTLYFFRDSKEINNDNFFKKIFSSMFQHAYFLKYFYKRRSFNHKIGELFGIYLFSKIFEELKPIKKWERKFFNKFIKQISVQTRSDGTNIEQSVNYHRFVLEFFSLFTLLNPYNINLEERNLIEKMYDYLLYLIKPNKTFPLVGDSDDGKVLLLTFFKKNSFINLISLGSILFQRGDLKYISENISISSILLLGMKGYEIYEKIRSQEPEKKNQFFKDGGYILLRNNWSEKANYLFVDFAKFGPLNASHSHSSVTNFIYCYKGKNIINDSGTFSYNKSWKDRNLFRSSKAHNILVLNNKDQAKAKSWFGWENKPKLKRSIQVSDDNTELSCIHNSYKDFIVDRKIIANNNLNKIIIKDKVISLSYFKNDKNIDINIFLHFDNKTKLKLYGNTVLVNDELKIEIFSGHNFEFNLEKSLYSPFYGIKEECPMLNIHFKNRFNENRIIDFITKISSVEGNSK